MARLARTLGKRVVILAQPSAGEAAFVDGIEVFPVENLADVVGFLRREKSLPKIGRPTIPDRPKLEGVEPFDDFSGITGFTALRRTFEIAGAGQHHVLINRTPCTGLPRLVKRILGILPWPARDVQLDISAVASWTGLVLGGQTTIAGRPFRAPHYGVTAEVLADEIVQARHGVLFLDEFTEIKPAVISGLGQPMADRSFLLVAAMSPCPCGYRGDALHECRCTPAQVSRSCRRVRGPLFDLIGMHVGVLAESRNSRAVCGEISSVEASAAIRERIVGAREIQERRFRRSGIRANADLSGEDFGRYCPLTSEASAYLQQSLPSDQSGAGPLRVARTIADLAGVERIELHHLVEALSYRGPTTR